MHFARKISDDDARALTQAIVRFLENGPAPRPWILDMSDVEEITASQRRLFADHEKRVAPLTKLHVTRLAYVVSSPIGRAILKAYLWIFCPSYPYRIFSERAAAEAWILGSLQPNQR